MACDRQKKTGCCGHFQCPHSGETEHGYDCVDVVDNFCEAGDGCLEHCEFSYPIEKEEEVRAVFEREYGG